MKQPVRLVLFIVCLILIGQGASADWNGINYQGRLLSGGAPFTGAANFQFSIYTQLAGGSYVYTEVDSAITVVDGLYTTVIGDNPSGLSPLSLQETLELSSPLFLEVTVGATTLTPRERLNAVPYAMDADTLDSLDSSQFLTALGGTMSNTLTAPVLTVIHGSASGERHAIKGVTESSSGGAAGVYGVANGEVTGLPMEGEMGVRGESYTGAGVGGFSIGDVGVFGMSSNGPGMMAASFNDYGLRAASLMSDAIYAEGSIKADKLVYRNPRTNYYMVGSKEFHTRGSEEYDNALGMYLYDGIGSVYAPVHLPHGATIVEFQAKMYDSVSTTGLIVNLSRDAIYSGSSSDMASVASSGSSGWQTPSTASISDPVVDNENYFYYAWAWNRSWSDTNKWLAATITYTVDEAP